MWLLTNKKKRHKYSSSMIEACWKIRTRIDPIWPDQTDQTAKTGKTLTIVSLQAAEGRTTVAVNLACDYAKKNKKVLMIDANLRKPTLHKLFGLSNRSGLMELLAERHTACEVIRGTMVPNLSLITCGAGESDPIELLTSGRIASFLEEVKAEFDLIVIDTPAATDGPDAQILSSLSDGVLLVVKDGKVKKEQALKLKAALESVNARIVGSVFRSGSRRAAAVR